MYYSISFGFLTLTHVRNMVVWTYYTSDVVVSGGVVMWVVVLHHFDHIAHSFTEAQLVLVVHPPAPRRRRSPHVTGWPRSPCIRKDSFIRLRKYLCSYHIRHKLYFFIIRIVANPQKTGHSGLTASKSHELP